MKLSNKKRDVSFVIEGISDIWRIICPMINEHLDNAPGYWCANQDGQGAWFSNEAEIEIVDMEDWKKSQTSCEVEVVTADKKNVTVGYMHQGPVFYTQLQHILNHLQFNPSIKEIKERIEETINQGYVLYQP